MNSHENQKYQILLYDYGWPKKPDKLIRKQYLGSTAMKKGKELCKEHNYPTFKLIVVKK